MPDKTPQPIRLAICGAAGRMGARLCAMAEESDQFELVARLCEDDDERANEQLARIECDAVIDFSSDTGANRAAAFARTANAALLVGTTGLSAQTLENIGVTSQHVPVMVAPNTSLGVAVIKHLAAQATQLLSKSFDIDMIDIHHRHKRDAPSGTALRIAEAMREASPNHHLKPERIHSLRAGDVVGEHQIIFSGPGEKILLIHAATSRELFVSGALRAAAWLVQQEPGRYTIEQSLGLTSAADAAAGD
jgi:4-hydroxy-tetrahydrodipicolinate reductase